jgi:hypothetical protein
MIRLHIFDNSLHAVLAAWVTQQSAYIYEYELWQFIIIWRKESSKTEGGSERKSGKIRKGERETPFSLFLVSEGGTFFFHAEQAHPACTLYSAGRGWTLYRLALSEFQCLRNIGIIAQSTYNEFHGEGSSHKSRGTQHV